jgi:N-acetyl-alpha-D-muramate 1-phosphate uridylyltransferase
LINISVIRDIRGDKNHFNMQIVILAGGLGTRLKAVAGNLPKALAPVAGRPFIEHQLELVRKHGLRDVLLCIGYGGDQIEKHVGNGSAFGMRIIYSKEAENRLLGTGGALVNALPLLQDRFMVLYGDSYLPTDYARVARYFKERNPAALMCVYRNENKWDKSNVKIAGEAVVFYSKKNSGENPDYIDYGLSLFRKSIIEAYASHSLPLDLAQIQEDLVARRQMAACEVKERFYEIGKPAGLAELEKHLKQEY